MINILLVSLAAVAAIFVIIVALRPSRFRIARSTAISAPASMVFGKVNALRQFQMWSPFAQMDPSAKTTFAGPHAGVGASLTWSGNKRAGEGMMVVTKSRPAEMVRMKLDFRKPFAVTNTAEFTFEEEGNKTHVTWSMTGTNSFLFKALGLLMNCEKMVGAQFEKGLATLKSQCESSGELMLTGQS